MTTDITKNYITGIVRASFVHVHEPRQTESGKMEYSMKIMIPKSDQKTLAEIQNCITAAMTAKFGADPAQWPHRSNLKIPLKDGDAPDEMQKDPAGAGHFTMNVRNSRKPGLVGPDALPMMNPIEGFYSGAWCRCSLNFSGFDKAGSKGVGVYVNNIMKIKDDERLDGRIAPEQEFSMFADPNAPPQTPAAAGGELFQAAQPAQPVAAQPPAAQPPAAQPAQPAQPGEQQQPATPAVADPNNFLFNS